MALKTNLKSLTPRRQTYKKQIQLPSHGFSSPRAWPDGKLNIFPWDSEIDEYLLELSRKSSSRQTVLFELVAKLCDLNGGNIDDFVADETNIVLLVARALSQDNTIKYIALCPYCAAKSAEEIRVPDELEKVSEKPSGYPGYDDLTLPDCKDVVRVRPLLVKDERIIAERPPEERLKISDNALRNILRIVSINDTTADSLAEYKAWFDAIPPKDVRFLEEEARKLSPHLNTAIPHICGNEVCRREFKSVVTFDQDFFR